MRRTEPIFPPAAVRARLPVHFSTLADHVAKIEEVLADAGAQGDEAIVRAQRMDFVRQSLEDLATLARAWEKAADWADLESALPHLRLASSRALLATGTASRVYMQETLREGDVDFF